jgi:hypothetical protein
MESCNIQFPSSRLYFERQKELFIPAVHKVYRDQQQVILDGAKKKSEVIVGGDARCDCMGYV